MQQHKNGFAIVVDKACAEKFLSYSHTIGRDVDLLPKTLGENNFFLSWLASNSLKTYFINNALFILGSLQLTYYLNSKHYISQRFIEKIDETKLFLLENGLGHFFESFSDFLFHLRVKCFNHINQLEANYDHDFILTVDKLKPTLIYLACMLTISLIIFIIEVIVYQVKKRHNSRRQVWPVNINWLTNCIN